MKRILMLTCVLAAAIALPSSASARIVELGGTADAAALNCPGTTEAPCVAAVRMTGYQGRSSGGPENPFYIRRDGVLVAFTVQLAKPTAEEINFFEDHFGTPSTARISVLAARQDSQDAPGPPADQPVGPLRARLLLRVQADVRVRPADPGQEGQLDRAHGAHLGAAARHEPGAVELVALLEAEGELRATEGLEQFALEDLREVAKFGCTYHGARLLYSVTYVPSNHVTNQPAN